MLESTLEASSTKVKTSEFEKYVSQSHRKVYSLAMRLTGNAIDAEDLVQEAFLRAYRFFDRYDPNQNFISWMYRIVTNVHIDLLRRKGRIRTVSVDSPNESGTTWEFSDADAAPDKILLENQMDEDVQLGLMSMTQEFRTAVVLADVEGMAYDEIADVMNSSIGTVRSRIHRGRKQLRDYLIKRSPDRFKEVVH